MSKIDPKFIVNLKGKEFVTYEGLLDLAHQKGLIGISTELLQIPAKENDFLAIVKAIATTKELKFEGIGDCDNKSANSMITPHKLRMAETRAKARALRDLTNVGMTAIEELGDDEEVNQKPKQTTNKKSDPKKPLVDDSLASDAQIKYINNLMKKKNYEEAAMTKYIEVQYSKKDLKALTKANAGELINMLNGM